MKKILFFPHLQMQSGHHQAAEALMDLVQQRYPDAEVKKVDLLSETNKLLERVITTGYLQWIKLAPRLYSKTYKKLYFSQEPLDEQYIWHQPLFLHKLKRILKEEQPDLIFCTHSLPSCMLSKLKLSGQCHVPVVNVYTDFFVHDYWGHRGIDAHFLPTLESKKQLQEDPNVPGQLIVTGIPVHRKISRPGNHASLRQLHRKPVILLAGGNSGLGCPTRMFQELEGVKDFQFIVLCGHNNRLYRKIESWNLPHIQPLSYVISREEMDDLYETADALVTKPGGVTVSEALRKRIPMFIHSALPGQEEMNLEILIPKGLVTRLLSDRPLVEQLRKTLTDQQQMQSWHNAMDAYADELVIQSEEQMMDVIEELLAPVDEEIRGKVPSIKHRSVTVT
ncbi:MGDG synthase family glycosyltransferase [Sporosarcina gallistercoris]|uniref:Galactosyldiacylglycerol synthase n=1 Tax=Sporosarcina gallistercoris TaxID=2762245 RepID=A0ABR8PME4_9BACL|nr:galactosyldiacylglycerol synthase [Sporosarcina gallistercoris]MBD7909343.1 galactosyldiacylglycerol synthase [Sporosarcina gallistercoris]